jgi:hypothetical protein
MGTATTADGGAHAFRAHATDDGEIIGSEIDGI